MGRGAWQATVVHRVTKSQTELKQLSTHAHWLEWSYRYRNKKKWSGMGPEKNQDRFSSQWTGSKSEKEYVKVVYCHSGYLTYSVQFSSGQSLSCVWLFANPWNAACITKYWSLLKVMSIESIMTSNRLILCHPLLLLPSIFPSIGLFQWVSSFHQVVKVFELQIQY